MKWSIRLLLMVALIGVYGATPLRATPAPSTRHQAIPGADLTHPDPDFTFAAWVYWKGGEPWQRIFDFGQDTNHTMFLTPLSGDNTLRFAITTDGPDAEQQLDAAAMLPAYQWVHVAVTLAGDGGTLYVNGTAVSSDTITLNPDDVIGPNMWLGKSQYVADPTFNGLLDEVAVFDRALSADEILEVYTTGWAAMYGKLLALHLDDAPAYDGATVYDASGQRHQGTLRTADADNKAIPGYLGHALALDGWDDYLALPDNLGDIAWMVIDGDALTVERDGDGDPYAFKGIPFVTSVLPEGVAKFSLVGDLDLAEGETLVGIGSRAISLYVAGDVSIAPGAVVDVSAVGTTPGPGGGGAGQGHPGGAGGFGSYASDDFTFAAWVYWHGGGPGQRIFDFGYDANHTMFLTPQGGGNTLRFAITTGGGPAQQQLNHTLPLTANQWVHVVVTLAGDSGTLYIDGSAVVSDTISLNPQDVVGANAWLGRSQTITDPYFYGLIDEAAVFDRALSADEISNIYRSGWDGMSRQVLGLHLEENPALNGTVLEDSSGRSDQGNYGTLLTADGYSHSSPGRQGSALSFDGANDYVDLVYLYSIMGEAPPGGAGGAGGPGDHPDNPIACLFSPGGDGQPGGHGGFDSQGGVLGTAGDRGGGTPGGDGVHSPESGGSVGAGGQGGDRGEGGIPQTGGGGRGAAGDGGVGFADTGHGSPGGPGPDGTLGNPGLPGQDGGNATGGLNTGSGVLISGGGGGGGGRAGGGGGAGGQGSSGSGGGGGGGGGGSCLNDGQAGGLGGRGGRAGAGGGGGQGGASGFGGAGAGALEIVALGWMSMAGQLQASGGNGNSFWAAGQPGLDGQAGLAGSAGQPGGYCSWCDSGDGGAGGSGGQGGDGSGGGAGGSGGVGAGGAGGSIKLAAFEVDGAGATIAGSGGVGGDPGNNDGGPGRFLLGQTFETPFAGTLTDASLETFSFVPAEPNPFIDGTPDTPFLPFLAGGPDIYGRLEGVSAGQLGEVLGEVPPQAGLAILLLQEGLSGLAWDIPGFDVLLVINPSCRAQQPVLGVGQRDMFRSLLERGPANHPDFGGSGPQPLTQLGPGEVYATMVPEGQQSFNLGLLDDDFSLAALFVQVLAYDQPLFLNTILACPRARFSTNPSSGQVPLSVTFSDQSTGGPTSWAWAFGDGSTSAERHLEHTYNAAGTFTVTLTVSNTIGSNTLIMPDCITAEDNRIYLPLVLRNAP